VRQGVPINYIAREAPVGWVENFCAEVAGLHGRVSVRDGLEAETDI
jgi:hypothetical protein